MCDENQLPSHLIDDCRNWIDGKLNYYFMFYAQIHMYGVNAISNT